MKVEVEVKCLKIFGIVKYVIIWYIILKNLYLFLCIRFINFYIVVFFLINCSLLLVYDIVLNLFWDLFCKKNFFYNKLFFGSFCLLIGFYIYLIVNLWFFYFVLICFFRVLILWILLIIFRIVEIVFVFVLCDVEWII